MQHDLPFGYRDGQVTAQHFRPFGQDPQVLLVCTIRPMKTFDGLPQACSESDANQVHAEHPA